MPRKPARTALAENAPWMPAWYELADASALQALVAGEANPDQQKRAVKWLIERAAGTYDMSYRPGPEGDRDTAFAEGRRFVGQQVVKLLRLNVSKLAREERTNG